MRAKSALHPPIAVLALVYGLVFLAAPVRLSAEEGPTLDLSDSAFTLQDYRGREVSLGASDAPCLVIAFLGTECPLAKLYGPRLQSLAEYYGGQQVEFFGVNANSQDSVTEIGHYVREHGIEFPVLKDVGNQVADRLDAQRTPEVFVLDSQRRVRYRGRIDDQYDVGLVRDRASKHELRAALDDLLAGRQVQVPRTEAVGCLIGRIAEPDTTSSVTYAGQISQILNKHCAECHRPGDIAPFSLTEYEQVAGWSEMIAEVIREQRMPPWHANPKFGDFANERLMSEQEKELVYEWVKAGAPSGDLDKVPPAPIYSDGWRLPRSPDQVIQMRHEPFVVPAQDTVDYQYFVVDPGFQEDKWVAAAQVIPGDRSVVHHALVFFRAPEGNEGRGIGWLGAYVPGQGVSILPDGHARRVPAGSKLIFQMHYTPNGTVQKDLTRLGLSFADSEDVKWEVVSLLGINHHFEIPPFADNYRVETELKRFPRGGRLLSIAPHMHLRGKSFRVVTKQAGHETVVLLDVPRYDFNWQHGYKLVSPLELSQDLTIRCIAHFDNSAENAANPDPAIAVQWGDQSWEEMMMAYFDVAVPRSTRSARVQKLTADEESEAEKVGRNLLRRFDENSDSLIRRDEVPDSWRVFAFRRLDLNADGAISLEEATEAARKAVIRKRASRARSGG